MLKRVSIQNFKSLKDVTLDLQKVNLLIGPNNSGKTNFLKALEFCHDAHISKGVEIESDEEDGPETLIFNVHAVSEVYNHSTTVFKKDTRSEIYFQLIFDGDSITDFSWSSEVSNITTREDRRIFMGNDDTVKMLKNNLGKIIIYKPDPNKLTMPGLVGTGQETVYADASNLVGFLDLMLGKYRKTVFARIETDINICIPEFNEIKIDDALNITEDLKRLVGDRSFKKIGLANSEQSVTYWADELSEGTLYFLALLCIINQPNPPKLLLLEEPEKGIHPRRIREVMDFIRRLVVEKDIQVIMTTHNPLLLDEFAESPESVFVFDKDKDGATFVKNLQRDVIEPANKKNIELDIPPVHYTDALGEYWTIGFLGGIPHEAV